MAEYDGLRHHTLPLTGGVRAPRSTSATRLALRLALAACGGVAYGLSARPGGWPAVIAAFAVLVEIAGGAPTLEVAALAAAAWALAGALAAFPWLLATGIAVYLIVAVGWGTAGLACGGGLWFASEGRWRYVLAPLLVAAWETLRVAITNGTALAVAPASLAGTPILRAAAWVGATGLTVALAACGTALCAARRSRPREALALVGCAAILMGTAFLPVRAGPPVHVAAVQTWLTNKEKWNPAHLERVLNRLEQLTVQAGERGAGLVVWPETAVPQDPFHDPVARAAIMRAAHRSRAWIVAGTETLVPPSPQAPPAAWRPANLLVLVTPDGQPHGAYAKVQRVPYGEPALAPGPGYRVLHWGSIPIGPMISWEVFTSAPFRAYARQGAALAVVPTSTAWAWGRIREVGAQEIAIAQVRAAEGHLPIVLAANGPAAIVSAEGRMLARGTPGHNQVLVASARTGGGVPGPFSDGVAQIVSLAALLGIAVVVLLDPTRWRPRQPAPPRHGLGVLAGVGGTGLMIAAIVWAEWMMSVLLGGPPVLTLVVVAAIGGLLGWVVYGPFWAMVEAWRGSSAAFALATCILMLVAGLLPVEGMDWLRVVALWTGIVRLAWRSPWGPAAGVTITAALLPVVAPR